MGFRARVTVLGSLNMDVSVTVPRLPEPGATVLGGGASYAPGGKGANQAVAAARLGAAVRMIGCVGDDDLGGRLRTALKDEGVADEGVRTVPGTPTGLAMITVDAAGENMITVAPGANQETGREEVAAVSAAPADALVISAEIPVATIRAALAASGPNLRILNLAPAPPNAAELIAAGADWLVVNESEAAAVLDAEGIGQDTVQRRPARENRPTGETRPAGETRSLGEARTTRETRSAGETPATRGTGAAGEARPERTRIESAADAAAELGALGVRNVVVTAGAAGAAYYGPGAADGAGSASVTVPGFRVRAVDSVGAGDTFVGALAVALAAGIPPEEAVRAAAAAGAAAATRPGTQSGMPRPADVRAATGLTWPVS